MDEAKEEMIEDSRKAGIEAYRNKDYQTALQHFDSAVYPLPSPLTTGNGTVGAEYLALKKIKKIKK